MNNLPPEILHCIFILLTLRQRQTCTLVCRHWFKALRKRSLLYNVEFHNNERLGRFIDMIQRQPRLANQVEILEIGGSFQPTFDCRKFCNMFPNLRLFFNNCQLVIPRTTRHYSTMFDCINPDSKLEMIADRNECEFTRQVFKSGSCSRLRSLNMSIYGFKELRTELFPFMNNMPYLESLYLDNCHLGIEDCETLHNNLPSLRSLNLYNIHLKIDQLPANIKPATFVTELNFSFECLGDKENHLRWYQYVSRKYTNLNDFSYDDMEVNNSSSEYSRKIHQDGLLPLYKTMGRRLKDLKLNNAPVDIGIFTQLDGSDCRIRFIDLQYNGDALFPQLAQSKQSKYVKKLSLEETYIASPSLLQNMTSLSSLTMVVEEKINLAEFMNAFPPTLTQFDVVCDDVEISHFPKYPNNIRELHIKSDDLPKTVGQLISTYCPKLKHLELRGRIFENIHIDCQNTHFKRLYIEARRLDNDRKHGFLLKYANASQSLCYVERPVPGKPDSPRVQLGSASELEGTTLIEITCASTNDMTLLTYIGDGMF